MAVPIVTMDKGKFPDIPPFLTIRTPCSSAKIDGANIIVGYTWINPIEETTGYVPGNATHVYADGNAVILLRDIVPTHIGGGGPVLGE